MMLFSVSKVIGFHVRFKPVSVARSSQGIIH